MTPDALNRAARQITLPQIGLEGQQRIAHSTVVVAGDDLACEVAARALAAAGVGTLRLARRTGVLPAAVAAALADSNPELRVETLPWPAQPSAWVDLLTGAAVALRSGFDDDAFLRAAIRLGTPAVVIRGRDDRIDVISFRRHGPCPHTPLDAPGAAGAPPQDTSAAVVAAHLAANEALVAICGAATGEARARHISISFGDSADGVRSAAIPWTPECFACGGSGLEMSFS